MKDQKDKFSNQENSPQGDRMMPVDPERRDENAFMSENSQRNIEAKNDNLHPSANVPSGDSDSGPGSDNPQGKAQSPKDVPGAKNVSQDYNSSTDMDINQGADSRSAEESKARDQGPYGVQEPGYESESEEREDR